MARDSVLIHAFVQMKAIQHFLWVWTESQGILIKKKAFEYITYKTFRTIKVLENEILRIDSKCLQYSGTVKWWNSRIVEAEELAY